jgi:hypothetical protein
MISEQHELSLKQYDETEPPYRLPDNMDVFSWSMPFLVDKVCGMFFNLMVKLSQIEIQDKPDEPEGSGVGLIRQQLEQVHIGNRKSAL